MPPTPPRVAALDALRGLMALSILVFHYASWAGLRPGAGDPLGRLGVYGVAAFYAISGASLALAYGGRPLALGAFWRRRVARIFPLLWLATALSALTARPDALTLALNLTGLIALAPHLAVATGAWSIGCELAFYAVFPIVLWLARRRPWPLAAGALALAAWWAWAGLDQGQSLAAQWPAYVSPLGQLPLFVAGVIVGVHGSGRAVPRAGALLCAVAALMLVAWPADGDPIALVTGWSRVAFTVACVLATAGTLWLRGLPAGPLGAALRWLGEHSYGIYLLHPLAWQLAGGRWLPALALTLAAATLSWRYLERPAIRLGRPTRWS